MKVTDTWFVKAFVQPCGCTPLDGRRRNNVVSDVWDFEIAECLMCGATWNESDDIEYNQIDWSKFWSES